MRSFAWTWVFALSLFGGWVPAPESGSMVEVEEQEALRNPESEIRVRKQSIPAPAAVPSVPAPAPLPVRRCLPAIAPDVESWISRRHERSPTA
jgi:hypothetical protein